MIIEIRVPDGKHFEVAGLTPGKPKPIEHGSVELRMLALGCPESLIANVRSKNVLVEQRGGRLNSPKRRIVKLTQDQIDHLVDNRDLNLYPLSGHELRQLANRRKRMLEILD